jgi:glycine/D-amino acid oxidase-like deaminating enzyme
MFLPPAFALRSSYAIASEPGVAPLWNEDAMIWEASGTYLYARRDADGRVIAGGGDESLVDTRARDRLIPEKAEEIARRLSALVGRPIRPHERWAAMFGSSPDGLPAIGPAANAERLWLASGFGGNGISFAAVAAELIGNALAGRPDPDMACFDPYRFPA